jgi:hypothetical protein
VVTSSNACRGAKTCRYAACSRKGHRQSSCTREATIVDEDAYFHALSERRRGRLPSDFEGHSRFPSTARMEGEARGVDRGKLLKKKPFWTGV